MIARIFDQKRRRYLIIGAGCALLNNLILIGGDALGLHVLICVTLTFVFVLPASYVAHACWTFEQRPSWLTFARFIGGSFSSLLVASVAIWSLHGLLGLPMWITAPTSTVIMVMYNYVLAHWAIKRPSLQ